MAPQGDLKTNIITLPTHILKNQQKHSEATGDLSIVLNAIATACKWITNVVRKAELLNVVGITGTTNVQAETQQKLDLLSNEIVINMLKGTQKVCLLISEEDDKSIAVDHDKRGITIILSKDIIALFLIPWMVVPTLTVGLQSAQFLVT